MTTVKKKNTSTSFRNVCIVMIWIITIYSSVVQHVIFQLPYGMLLIGGGVLLSYIFANSEEPFAIRDAISEENIWLLWFMVYIAITGLLFSPNRNSHISQWITCMEYLFIQIVVASIIRTSGTYSFHSLLIVISLILSVIFIRKPVDYLATGRYSISQTVNPNGLGLGFVAGIWAVLYKQQRSKQSLFATSICISLFGYCILLTASRKSLIGAGIAVTLWLFFCFFPSLKEKDTRKGIASFFFMFILVIIMAWAFKGIYANSMISERMDSLFSEISEGNRSNMYRDGYELIKRNPLFGMGFQSFQYYFGSYSHATLVEIPVSGGIIGAILYFSAYLISLVKLISIYIRTKTEQRLSSEHIRGKMLIILWLVMAFFTVSVIHPYQFDSSLYYGIIIGETAYLEYRISSTQQDEKEKSKIRSKYIK